MSAIRLCFQLNALTKAFGTIGIHLLETFQDGQTRWGDQPSSTPYKGRSAMAHPYMRLGGETQYDIFTIRTIVDRLGKNGQLEQLEASLIETLNPD